MVGGGMVGSSCDVNQGDLHGTRVVFMHDAVPKSRRAGVRASIVAQKRGNARGAKGRRKVDDEMSNQMEINSRQFSGKEMDEREKATSAGVRSRWSWTEPMVWTDRMLTALEEGVKGGKWYCLMDKVLKPGNLESSFAKVKTRKGSAGIDHVTAKMFEGRLDENLAQLRQDLKEGRYTPSPVKRTLIPKPGSKEMRPLGIPTVRDRTVQGALRHVLEPIFERDFAPHSYGFRPGRGSKDALRRVQALLNQGKTWVVDADIKGYFDAIPHDRLMARLREKVSDRTVLGLVEKFLQQDIFDGLKRWKPAEGSPQGAVLSPLLANIYLDPLDHIMARQGWEMLRYADDFVVLCANDTVGRERGEGTTITNGQMLSLRSAGCSVW